MAEGKKTFIFYSDWINMVREMDNEDAGELLKHILSYVNDENPETKNKFVKMAFGHMKPLIKSDLVKWDGIRETRKQAGSKGGKATQANAKQKQANAKQVQPVNVNVNVNTINNKDDGDVFSNYIDEIKTHQMYVDSFYMQFKVSHGSISKLLNKFIVSLGLKEDKPKSLKDFKSHFINWCNVQDRIGKLNEYKKNKSRLNGSI